MARPGSEEVATTAAAWEVASIVIIAGVAGACLDEVRLRSAYQNYS